MKVVADASVIVKWVLPDRESDMPQALILLDRIRTHRLAAIQPVHWMAEVAAVVTRLQPKIAAQALDLLDAMELAVASELAIYQRASLIAAGLAQHLFDTLYHAVALERDATLVTADRRYFLKARHLGSIALLGSWVAPS